MSPQLDDPALTLYRQLCDAIREESRAIAPDYPDIQKDLGVHEHLWAITSSYEGTESARQDWVRFAEHLAKKLGLTLEQAICRMDKNTKG